MAEKKITLAETEQTFPEAPTPVAEAPVAAEPMPRRYYVVQHDAVDGRTKDTIVAGDVLGSTETIERLLGLGAIRPLE